MVEKKREFFIFRLRSALYRCEYQYVLDGEPPSAKPSPTPTLSRKFTFRLLGDLTLKMKRGIEILAQLSLHSERMCLATRDSVGQECSKRTVFFLSDL